MLVRRQSVPFLVSRPAQGQWESHALSSVSRERHLWAIFIESEDPVGFMGQSHCHQSELNDSQGSGCLPSSSSLV